MAIKIEDVREALVAGDRIMITQIAEPESKRGIYYTLLRSGRSVPKRIYEALKDDLVSVEPGLFDGSPPPDAGPVFQCPMTVSVAAATNREG
ncbi:hypothetical protein PANO111632_02825 [Paracoccus nototheniae]|uniref:Transcriptional regulator n=1 Tax=Paracoccus nototheniae TaxID=2489002 RepID=A0ABW4DV67_9RHOB|nr:hypothetical protein [Paracoccus nototheniae]